MRSLRAVYFLTQMALGAFSVAVTTNILLDVKKAIEQLTEDVNNLTDEVQEFRDELTVIDVELPSDIDLTDVADDVSGAMSEAIAALDLPENDSRE